ncbi:hypothetical protein B2G51_12105 [Leptospira santarosai]|nr:hypothetical protein B2G51_12105 [Leptospira santarosai]
MKFHCCKPRMRFADPWSFLKSPGKPLNFKRGKNVELKFEHVVNLIDEDEMKRKVRFSFF